MEETQYEKAISRLLVMNHHDLDTVLSQGIGEGGYPIGEDNEGHEEEYVLDGRHYMISTMPGRSSFSAMEFVGNPEDREYESIKLDPNGIPIPNNP